MTGNKSRFLSFSAYDGGSVTFGLKHNFWVFPSSVIKEIMWNFLVINVWSLTKTQRMLFWKEQGKGTGERNIYVVDLNFVPKNNLTRLSVINDDAILWHMHLGHDASFSLLDDKLRSKDLVLALPSIKFHIDCVCDDCAKGKHIRSSFKS